MSAKVGITGGIGSGKSLVCQLFALYGIPIYDADSRAKMLITEDEQVRQEIIQLLGPQAYQEDGSYNRSYVARQVFENPELLKGINRIVHPAVGRDYQAWHEAKRSNHPYTIKEAALLIEAGSYKDLDYLILVRMPLEQRMAYIQQRDPHRTREDIEAIIAKQMSDEEKQPYSDAVVWNDTQRSLIEQVGQLHAHLSGSDFED